jgi:hypothetical protein
MVSGVDIVISSVGGSTGAGSSQDTDIIPAATIAAADQRILVMKLFFIIIYG